MQTPPLKRTGAFFHNLLGLKHKEDFPLILKALFAPLVLVTVFSVDAFFEGPPSHQQYLFLIISAFYWLFIARHNYILHNHVHSGMSRNKRFNRLLDYLLGFTTGMTAGNWRMTHVHGHHAAHHSKKLPNRWFPYDEVNQETLKAYSWTNAFWFSLKTLPTQLFGYFFEAFRRSSLAGKKTTARARYYRYIFLESLVLYSIALLLLFLSPFLTLLFLIIPYLLTHFFSRYTDYMFHVGAKVDINYQYCFNCTNQYYNKECYNVGYHVAHHDAPKLHWSKLPEYYDKMTKKNPVITHNMAREYNFSGFHLFTGMHRRCELETPRSISY